MPERMRVRPWIVIAALLVAAVVLFALVNRGDGDSEPTPRPTETKAPPKPQPHRPPAPPSFSTEMKQLKKARGARGRVTVTRVPKGVRLNIDVDVPQEGYAVLLHESAENSLVITQAARGKLAKEAQYSLREFLSYRSVLVVAARQVRKRRVKGVRVLRTSTEALVRGLIDR
jgi:hypothetical protein